MGKVGYEKEEWRRESGFVWFSVDLGLGFLWVMEMVWGVSWFGMIKNGSGKRIWWI